MIRRLVKNDWLMKITTLTLVGLLLVPFSGVFAQEMAVPQQSSAVLAQGKVVQQQQEKNYYHEGKAQAEADYTGGSALMWGLETGVLWGAILWVTVATYEAGLPVGLAAAIPPTVGYLFIDKDVTVPGHFTSNLTTQQRRKFELGYKVGVRTIRKKKYYVGAGIGAGIGGVIAAVITLAATQ